MMKSMLSRQVISSTVLSIIGAILITIGLAKSVQAVEGDVWLTPVNSDVETSQNFDVEVHIDTGAKDLGAFNVFFDFDATKMTIDLTQGEDPTADSGKGFHKGADAAGYMMMSNAGDISNGHFRFAGIAGGGYANGSNQHIVTIHVQSTVGFIAGVENLTLRVNELSDELGHALTTGTVTLATATFQAGDTAAPVRSNWFPDNDILSPGTTQVNLTLDTNENATCKYGTIADTAYNSIAGTFTTTGTTAHSTLISGLSDGNEYTYYIRCEDGGSHQNNNDLIVSFKINSAPTDISVSSSSIDENEAINTVVGTLSTTDADGSDAHTYSLACTVAGADDASFNISSNELRASESFDYEVKNSYSICIKTDDGHSGTFDKNFTITVNDLGDTTPVVTETTPVVDPTNDVTPDYTFASTEAGTIAYTGDCSSATTSASSGDNTITFNALTEGTHSNCTITVTNGAAQVSNILNVSAFTIDTTSPTALEVTAVATPTNDNTPSITLDFSEHIDSLSSSLGCMINQNSNIGSGNQTFTVSVDGLGTGLADGSYGSGATDCYITSITDDAGNINAVQLDFSQFTIDTTAPVAAEVTVVPTPTNDNTPDYTFSSDEAGTITYGGDCSSATTAAVPGDNTITFNTLGDGTHSNCTITVTDATNNISNTVNVTTFIVDALVPVIVEVTPVSTPANDTTPDYTFNASEAGTITYGGDCSSATTAAVPGDNTITFNALVEGVHSNCTITIEDGGSNDSNVLNVTPFTIDTTAPVAAEVTVVPTPTNDNTPDYTFSSDEAGTIIYGGDCSSATTAAIPGDNTITFNALTEGVHANCTIVIADAAGNNSNTINVTAFTVATPPIRSNGAPTGSLALGTTQTTISLDTHENATCKYSTVADTTYAAMTNTFSTTGATTHSTLVTGLIDGGAYAYYVRCEDGSAMDNEDDFVISFSINATCTSFTYSSWGTCQSNNTQTRTITSNSPASCTGGSPVTTQSCTYTSVDAGTDFNDFTPKVKLKGLKKKYKLDRKKKIYLKEKKLSFRGTTLELIGGKVQLFIDGKLEDEAIIGADGKWKLGEKVKKSGAHKLRFKYFDSAGNFVGESSSYKFKIDTKKPKFIDLPGYLTKRAGDKVHFEATDTKSKKIKAKKGNKIKYYKYYFLGKKHKTKDPYFVIPAGTPKGLHTLKVRAYDKAGNKAKKTVIINVR